MESKCVMCGKTFTHTKSNAMYCSSACRNRATYNRNSKTPTRDTVKICDYCGKEFKPIHKNMRFCSLDCQYKGTHNPVPTENINCIICGKSFLPARFTIKCCSPKCSKENTKRKSLIRNRRIRSGEVVSGAKRGKYNTNGCAAWHYNPPPRKRAVDMPTLDEMGLSYGTAQQQYYPVSVTIPKGLRKFNER